MVSTINCSKEVGILGILKKNKRRGSLLQAKVEPGNSSGINYHQQFKLQKVII